MFTLWLSYLMDRKFNDLLEKNTKNNYDRKQKKAQFIIHNRKNN